MTESPSIGVVAVAIFCDDLRYEVGNKITLVGTYATDMYVSEFPAFLPRLGISCRVTSDLNQSPDGMVLRVSKGDELLIEATVPREGDHGPRSPVPGQDPRERRMVIVNLNAPPMSIKEPCTLRATVEVGGTVYQAGKLHIALAPKNPEELLVNQA